MKHIYLISGLLLCATALGSCSDMQDIAEQPMTEGTTPILFSGVLSRTATDDGCGDETTSTYSNLHLSAKTDDDKEETAETDYFTNIAINGSVTLPSTETTETAALTPASTLNYPLGGIGLRFFAYSGVATNGSIALKAGNEAKNDIILSNGTDNNEGKGTYGDEKTTSDIPLTFRHVMTKIVVAIEVDKSDGSSSDNDYVEPNPKDIQITLNDGLAVVSGNYPITAKAIPTGGSKTDVTNSSTSNYTLLKGVNYLVPNGALLTGSTGSPVYPIKKIVIDDYDTNGTTDCSGLTITPATGNSHTEIKLLPGQAYGIVFKVKRLKVTGITFKKIDWNTVVLGNESSSYIPAKLTMNLGEYAGDKITKVVLHTEESSNKKQYIANVEDNEENNSRTIIGQFVTLPTSVTKADLYTDQGLLVAGVTPNSYKATGSSSTDKDIILTLSKGGMKTVDSSKDYDATSNPYSVETPVQFRNLSLDKTASYQQANDLDLETLSSAFTPFTEEFTGTYDGNSQRILHATFTGNGLFSDNTGTLKNIHLASGKISATGTHAGSICGTNTGTIVACTNEAQIHGTATHAGGICGNNSGSIIACLNTGDIFTGSDYSGGICGENTNTTAGAITACVNVGMMYRKSSKMGGICGVTVTDNSPLKTCYWLTGTAKAIYDDNSYGNDVTEVAAWSSKTTSYISGKNDDVADLSPQKLRNGYTNEETETNKTITALLNAAISTQNTYKNQYQFTYDVEKNGCVWPMPVKIVTP